MTMAQLHAFLEVAQHSSISIAAERLYMSQPTLSRQISTLEDELGVRLFVRKTNSLSLTTVGEFFYHHAADLYRDYDSLVRQTRELAAGVRGTLRIALLEDQMLDEKLAEGLHRLLQAHPSISVEVERGSYKDILEMLERQQVDACQSTYCREIPVSDYRVRPLTTEPICLVVNREYISISQPSVRSDEIAGLIRPYPLMAASLDAFPDPIRRSLPALDETYISFQRVSAFSTTEVHLLAGTAATIGNCHGLLHASPHIQMIPIEDYPPMTQALLYLDANTNPLLTALLEQLD